MASLHFVEHQKQIALVAKFAQPDQVFRLRDRDPALTLDWLDQDRGGFRGNGRAHRFEIVERDLLESFNRRLESFLYFFLPSGGDARQRAFVERVDRRDDFVTAFVAAKFPGELEQA